jgi:uncharacterized membrane protein
MLEAENRHYGISRLIDFSDGVFAFAITLLIITIPYPTLPSPLSAGLFFAQLLTLKWYLVSYLLSFYIVGLFWLAHHHYFQYIIKFDTGLFFINLTLLLFIAFLPFPTNLIGHYGNTSIIAAFYAGMLSLVNFLYLLLWWYASSRYRLIPPTLEKDFITFERLKRLISLSIFVISVGLALISPFLAMAAWITTFFVPTLIRRKYVRKGDE